MQTRRPTRSVTHQLLVPSGRQPPRDEAVVAGWVMEAVRPQRRRRPGREQALSRRCAENNEPRSRSLVLGARGRGCSATCQGGTVDTGRPCIHPNVKRLQLFESSNKTEVASATAVAVDRPDTPRLDRQAERVGVDLTEAPASRRRLVDLRLVGGVSSATAAAAELPRQRLAAASWALGARSVAHQGWRWGGGLGLRVGGVPPQLPVGALPP